MASGNMGKNKCSTKDKPFSSFIMLNINCKGCGKRIDLRELENNICPICGTVLPVSDQDILKSRLACEKEKKKHPSENQPELNAKSEFDDQIEVGTFIFAGKKKKEYMVVEKRNNQYRCLCVIDDCQLMDDQYVQRAYKNKLIVISTNTIMVAAKDVKATKARLPIQFLNTILEKYQKCIENAKYVTGKVDKNTSSYKRNNDGLYNGNSWDGLSMTKSYVKIYRG